MLVLTDNATTAMITEALAATGAAGWLNACSIVLFTNEIVPAHDTVYADLVQPTYAGYAAKDAVWGAPYSRASDFARCVNSGLLQWQMTDALLPTVINGYAICLKAAPNTLYALELLPAPKQLLTVNDALLFSAEVALGSNAANYGAVDVVVP